MKKPLVSVIIPTHNRADLLPRAINSVLRQSYQKLECIVVDDGSADRLDDFIARFKDERIIYFHHETSRGASAARNTGISRARGKMIAFLDDDDEWLPVKLEKQVPLLEAAPPQVGMVYCWMDYYDGDNIVDRRHPQLKGDIFQYTLASQPIGNASTLLVRRSVIDDVGFFDEDLPRGNDGDFIRRVCRNYHVDFVPDVLVRVFVGHDERITSSTQERWEKGIRAQRAKLRKFGDDLAELPEVKANILIKLGYFYCRAGDAAKGMQYFLAGIKLNPRSMPRTFLLNVKFLICKIPDYFMKWLRDKCMP